MLLAISITNYEAEKIEKQDLVKLLRSTDAVIETSYEYGEALSEYHNTLTAASAEKDVFFDKNPLPYPDYLDTLISQNIVSKNLSQEMLTDPNEIRINLKKTRRNHIALYLKLLNQARDMIKREILYQQGELSISQLQERLDQIEGQIE